MSKRETERTWQLLRTPPVGWRWAVTVVDPDGRQIAYSNWHLTKRGAMRKSERVASMLGWRF